MESVLDEIFSKIKGKVKILEIGSSSLNQEKTFDSYINHDKSSNSFELTHYVIDENLNPSDHSDNKIILTGDISNNCHNFSLDLKFDFIIFSDPLYFKYLYVRNCLRLSKESTLWVFDLGESKTQKSFYSSTFWTFTHPLFINIRREEKYVFGSLKQRYIANGNLPTLVTQLYDIRSKEGNGSHQNKNIEQYLDYGQELLDLGIPLVIYTDASLEPKIRSRIKKSYHIRIKVIEFEETEFYSYTGVLRSLRKEYIISNLNSTKETVYYNIVGCNKMFFLEDAIQSNPFGSNSYVWIDFGVKHVSGSLSSIKRWIYYLDEKVRCMELNPYIEDVQPKEYFKYIRHNMAGGIISGSVPYLEKFINEFRTTWKEMMNDQWFQLEEAVISVVNRDRPDLFNNYYGEFDHIIDGYDMITPKISIQSKHLYFKMIDKCLDSRNYEKCYHILQYGKHYFLPHNEQYLNKYIICNYYVSPNKMLDSEIIESLLTPPLDLSFLEKMKKNLTFYANVDQIIQI